MQISDNLRKNLDACCTKRLDNVQTSFMIEINWAPVLMLHENKIKIEVTKNTICLKSNTLMINGVCILNEYQTGIVFCIFRSKSPKVFSYVDHHGTN